VGERGGEVKAHVGKVRKDGHPPNFSGALSKKTVLQASIAERRTASAKVQEGRGVSLTEGKKAGCMVKVYNH